MHTPHTHVCKHAHTCAHMHINMHTHACTHACTHICIPTRACMYTYIHAHTYMHMCTHIHRPHTYIHAHVHTYTHANIYIMYTCRQTRTWGNRHRSLLLWETPILVFVTCVLVALVSCGGRCFFLQAAFSGLCHLVLFQIRC